MSTPLTTYRVRIERHQVWNLNIAASSPEEAKTFGDELSNDCHPNNDYAYSTDVQGETDAEPDNQ